MKVGDLVRMKHTFWRARKYTKEPALVCEIAHRAIKVMFSDGRVKSDLAEWYEVINE